LKKVLYVKMKRQQRRKQWVWLPLFLLLSGMLVLLALFATNAFGNEDMGVSIEISGADANLVTVLNTETHNLMPGHNRLVAGPKGKLKMQADFPFKITNSSVRGCAATIGDMRLYECVLSSGGSMQIEMLDSANIPTTQTVPPSEARRTPPNLHSIPTGGQLKEGTSLVSESGLVRMWLSGSEWIVGCEYGAKHVVRNFDVDGVEMHLTKAGFEVWSSGSRPTMLFSHPVDKPLFMKLENDASLRVTTATGTAVVLASIPELHACARVSCAVKEMQWGNAKLCLEPRVSAHVDELSGDSIYSQVPNQTRVEFTGPSTPRSEPVFGRPPTAGHWSTQNVPREIVPYEELTKTLDGSDKGTAFAFAVQAISHLRAHNILGASLVVPVDSTGGNVASDGNYKYMMNPTWNDGSLAESVVGYATDGRPIFGMGTHVWAVDNALAIQPGVLETPALIDVVETGSLITTNGNTHQNLLMPGHYLFVCNRPTAIAAIRPENIRFRGVKQERYFTNTVIAQVIGDFGWLTLTTNGGAIAEKRFGFKPIDHPANLGVAQSSYVMLDDEADSMNEIGVFHSDYAYSHGIGNLDACNGGYANLAGTHTYGYFTTTDYPFVSTCVSGGVEK
jgi:hypothetical protein